MIITIDGPAGTGKSTVAKQLAARLHFQYFDTGAMYRSVAWIFKQKGIEKENRVAIEEELNNFQFIRREKGGGLRYFVNGEDVTEEIRKPEISGLASEIATLPAVREALWKIQREFGSQCDAVFEGRDMGSHVFPHADLKFFLTARPQVRAERRYRELLSKDSTHKLTKQQIEEELKIRDLRDEKRILAPLIRPEGAIEIDTSDLTVDEIVNKMIEKVPGEKR